MSYSRWCSSHWYTFWRTQPDETENRNTAIFEICGVASFTAKQLRTNLQNCIKQVKKVDDEGDIDELLIYINDFLLDVDNDYPISGRKR